MGKGKKQKDSGIKEPTKSLTMNRKKPVYDLMKIGGTNTKEHLAHLFRKHKGSCCYCKRKTEFFNKDMSKNTPEHAATIEHIYTKLDIRRCFFKNSEKTKLACYKCNTTKSHTDYDKVFNNVTYSDKEYSRKANGGLLIKLLSDQINSFII